MMPFQIVKSYYSNPEIVRQYITVGLYPAEETLIDRYFKSDSTVLDIGCGAGRTTIALSKKGYRATGIDLIPEMIDAANSQAATYGAEVDFQIMDAVNMEFPDESFQNAFFSFNGIENIPGKNNREKVIADVYRVLKRGGCFILTARSGLAFGRRSIGWIWISVNYMLSRLLNNRNGSCEFGDKVWKGQYHHYISPFYLRRIAGDKGFTVLYSNSSKNIEINKSPCFLTDFTNDKMILYVLRK